MADVMERLQRALAERFAIEREIGRGGMAVVYLAADLRHRRRVALKVVHPELAQALGPERFLQEVNVTAQLRHPHVLPLYDSGVADGLLYYVMPYVEGESLRSRLDREKQLPVDDALRIAREVADALAYAHSRDVIHRDIKPENILLESGHAVVADFGIARAISAAGGQRLTDTGVTLGTPAYMSPEQAAGERDLDGRTDLYSLGCVLYEMLAGAPPITGPNAVSILARKSVEAPRPIRHVRSAVPDSVERAVTVALSVVPADRQRTAAEFSAQLSSADALHAARSPRIWTARPRLIPTVGAVAALAMLSTAVALWRARTDSSAAAQVADRVVVLPYDNQTGDAGLDPIGRMVAEWITEGLTQTSEVQAVPNLIVLETLEGIERDATLSAGESSTQKLARVTRARLAVSGSYYRRGDALEFHSEVLDVESGQPLGAVEAVLGNVSDPTPAMDAVRLRVMGVLAARLAGTGWEIPATVRPPSYEAYRAYEEGMRQFTAGDYADAAVHFKRAYGLDTTYLRVLMNAWSAYANGGMRAPADSLFEFLGARRDRLSRYDQYRLEFVEAGRRGDLEGRLRAAQQAARLVPIGTARFGLIVTLRSVNRPTEALAELQDLKSAGIPTSSMSWYALWGIETELYHLVQQHEQELAVAREGRARLATSPPLLEYQGRALAALNRTDELHALIEEVRALRGRAATAANNVLLTIAQELRAHGRSAEAGELADRTLAWYDSVPNEFTLPARQTYAALLYLRERWRDAAAQWDSIPADADDPINRLGRRAVLAARQEQSDSARAMAQQLARLEQPLLNGRNTIWRARIAALLGDRNGAVRLLRQALAEGVGYGIWLHTDMDLEPLREYAPYLELVRAGN